MDCCIEAAGSGRAIHEWYDARSGITNGREGYLGTVAGVVLITLPQSILSVMQMPDAGRQVIYGVVIIAMLLLYGRERLMRERTGGPLLGEVEQTRLRRATTT